MSYGQTDRVIISGVAPLLRETKKKSVNDMALLIRDEMELFKNDLTDDRRRRKKLIGGKRRERDDWSIG